MTCGWGAPPYFPSGLAPLPACWGWLALGLVLGLVLREMALVALLSRGWAARSRGHNPKTRPAQAAWEVLRSWELGGESEVAELAAHSGLSTTALLCSLLRDTLPPQPVAFRGRSRETGKARRRAGLQTTPGHPVTAATAMPAANGPRRAQ